MNPIYLRPDRPEAGAPPGLNSRADRPAEVSLSPDSAPVNPQLATLNCIRSNSPVMDEECKSDDFK
jgi:hypothetical protein